MNILIVVLFTLGARTSKIKTVDIYIAIALLINTLISVIAAIFNINKDNKERIIKTIKSFFESTFNMTLLA